MTINRNGFIDMGNGLFINMDRVKDINENDKSIITYDNNVFEYNEFPRLNTYTLREECFESHKGDFIFFSKGGK